MAQIPATTPTPPIVRDTTNIESINHEDRLFNTPADVYERIGGAGGAYVSSLDEYRKIYKQSIDDPESFWSEKARELDWFKPWSKVAEWNPPDAKWVIGGKTNICHNCVDRQVKDGFGEQTAIIWEGEPEIVPSSLSTDQHHGHEIRRLTYNDLLREVSKLANALKKLGVKKGDVVTIYMGMVPELPIAMLACARIGAPHSIIFGGFSAHAIADRVNDANSKIIITADGAWRRGKVVPLKENVDAACAQTNLVQNVIVLKRCNNAIEVNSKRDHWWHDVMKDASDQCPCEPMDSEDMLFLLYTSGSTGKPKGIMHTTGGYMVLT